MDKSELELHLKPSELSLIQDHPIFGFLQKNADYHLLAISINTLIQLKVHLTSPMEESSTSPMDQEPSLDMLVKTLLQLPLARLKLPNSDK